MEDKFGKNRKTALGLLAAFCLVLLSSNSAQARISRNLGGSISIGYSSTHQDSLDQENVDQEYSLSWQKSILRNLMVKSSARYYNFGMSESRGANSWRSELQPSGEVIWNERWWSLSAAGTRRDSRSNDRSSHLIEESLTGSLRSQVIHYPWIRLIAQQQTLVNRANPGDRDTRDRTASVGTGYSWRSTAIAYSYAHKNTLDRSRQIQQKSHNHTLQFDQSRAFLDNKLRSSLSYSFSYKEESNRNLAFEAYSLELPLFLGFYGEDATPDLGGVDTVATLIDGNIAQPALPLIDIGSNHVNQNIGVDLGYVREVSLIYIHTDRPSGNNVRWDVYQSEDNAIWTAVAGPSSNYSPGFSRYEINFPAVNSRYIKAVNKGLNEIDTVYVTEISALQRVADIGTTRRNQKVHLATLNNNLTLSSKWSANASVSMRRDGGNTLSRQRDETYYSLGLRNQLSKTVTQNARLQLGYMDLGSTGVDVDKIVSANYDLQYRPLQTLDFSVTLSHRDSYIAQMKYQEINYTSVRVRGDVLPRLRVSNELSGGRNTLFASTNRLDTWSYRLGLEGQVTQRLNATAEFLHQNVRELSDSSRAKNLYDLGFSYDVSQNISIRGNVSLTNDGHTRMITHDYSLGWLISPKLSAGAAIYLSDFQNSLNSRSERYGAQLEYSLSRRTVITGSYSENDLTSAGGGSNRSVRIGMRTGI